jgi:Uma2 family endonuclease
MVAELEQVGAAQSNSPQSNGTHSNSVRGGPWRWTVEQYQQAGELGWFEGQRVQLIEGKVIQMNPMGEPHAIGTTNLAYAFIDKLPRTLRVRSQMPIYPNNISAPEPDIAVVDADLIGQRLSTARLVVEVSDATLAFDRTTKATLYASAQVPEYWIVNVNARTLEVLREPIEDDAEPLGWRYGSAQTLRENASLAPLCAPDVTFSVSELLP